MQAVSDLLDSQPLGAFRIRVLALCAAVLVLDGIDAQAIGYAAPALRTDWGLGPAALGPVLSAGLVGIMLGSLGLAPVSDRLGRRPTILIAMAVVGFATVGTAAAGGIGTLLLARFVTGLGLGAAMGSAVALISDYAPARRRTLLVAVTFSGFTLGGVIAGLVAHRLVPTEGWRSIFLFGGMATLLFLPVAAWLLPESVRFLLERRRNPAQLARILARIAPDVPPSDLVRPSLEAGPTRSAVSALLGPEERRLTLILWTVFFMSLLDLYLLTSWLPTMLAAADVPVDRAILSSTVMQTGGLLAALPVGWLVDRLGVRRGLAPIYLLGAAAIVAVGQMVAGDAALLPLATFLAGVGIIGGQAAINGVAAASYPTLHRATGVSWCLGIGRVGSIVGPLVGAALLAAAFDPATVFLFAAVPAVVAAAALFVLGGRREAPPG